MIVISDARSKIINEYLVFIYLLVKFYKLELTL
jgi:hypothetical protein